MKKNLFKEKQRFDSKEIFGIVVFLIGVLIYTLFTSLQSHHWGFTYVEWSIVGLFLLLGGYLWYLTHLRLHLFLTKEGIIYKMKPFHSKKKKILWKDVASCEVIKTPVMAQWHGGNITFSYEKTFTLNGRNGLHITTLDGEEIFLGSKRLNDLKKVVKKALTET